ncbi:MAG: pilus assembly PilX N-terminal domain-containing protein [Candidatus Margulisiibacteriota bacterium]
MKNGFALIVAIFVVVLFAVLGVVAVSLLSGESIMALRDLYGIQALELADAGLQYTLAAELATDPDWSDKSTGFSKNLSPGQFNVNYIYWSENQVIVQVTGVVGGVSRTIQSTVKRGGLPAAFTYSLYAANQGGQDLNIENSATIFGDFYYDGNVIMKNSSRLLNGTMYSDSLTLLNSATCANYEPIPQPPVPLPTLATGYYDNLLLECSKEAAGPLNWSSGTKDLLGQTQRYTSINISASGKVISSTGPAMLVATTGNFTIQNSGELGNNLTVVASQQASFLNSAKVGANFKLVAAKNVTISNSGNISQSLLFTYGNITFNNSAYYYGSIIAPTGMLSSVNSTRFRGLIYAGQIDLMNSTSLIGSIVIKQNVSHLRNSTTVTYDPSYLPTEWPPGLEGGISVSQEGTSDWQEVY